MLEKLLKIFNFIDSRIYFFLNRKKLKNTTFTIISDNCWWWFVYQDLKLIYNSPFVGLFLFPECYLKLISNFKENIILPLHFIQKYESKYASKLEFSYPIGTLLGTDIEIHFLHYSTEGEALIKWNRRKKRINFDNILFKINGNFSNRAWVEKFKKIPLKNKLILDEWFAKKYTYHRKIQIIKYLNNLNTQ